MRLNRWVALGLALGVAAGLRADAAAAATDMQLGQQYQGAKQWAPAVRQFLKALQDDPQATQAYKALGTTYYLAGDRRGALAYYTRYLQAHPEDQATRAFAGRLQASLGGAPAAAAPKRDHGGFSVRLEGGVELNNGADVAQLYTYPGQTAAAPGGMAAGVGLGLDQAWDGGFVLGFDFMDGPSRGYKVGFSYTSATDNLTISNLTFALTPGWRFKMGNAFLLEPRLGVGYMLASVNVTNSVATTFSAKWTATGLAIWPQARAEYLFGSWGLGLNLGYLIAGLSPVKDDQGNIVKTYSATGTPPNWTLNNGGVTADVFVAYHFNPPF